MECILFQLLNDQQFKYASKILKEQNEFLLIFLREYMIRVDSEC